MNKIIKILLSAVIALIIIYFGYTFSIALLYQHHVKFFTYRQYSWIFNESVRNDIDTLLCTGDVRKTDSYYTYKIKDIYVGIWEFKNLDTINLKNIAINQNINLDKIKFNSGEVLNTKDRYFPEITVRFKLPFEGFLCINTNESTKIINYIESKNYKGFYGTINKMSFSNANGEHLILFDYGYAQQPTLFLLYKRNSNFYLIMINSEKPFDASIINILNLE